MFKALAIGFNVTTKRGYPGASLEGKRITNKVSFNSFLQYIKNVLVANKKSYKKNKMHSFLKLKRKKYKTTEFSCGSKMS